MTSSRAFVRSNRALPWALLLASAWSLPLATVMSRAHGEAPKQAPSSAAPGKAVDAAGLLSAFSKMPGLEARFREEKHMALLAKPLESRGVLFFTHPGLLLRRVESPRASEVIISADSVRLRDASGEQALDLRTRKDLRPFVESLTWILAGNRKALDSVYAVSFQPESASAAWQLTLKPKVEPLSRLIAHIRITGRGYAVAQIEVGETNGDKTITHILEANPKRSFDAAERAKLFGVGAPGAPRAVDAGAARPKP
jgi:outer membrane lipoprotein-sorting protein